jgi:hypothetical protein
MTTKTTVLIEANKANVAKTISAITEFAAKNNFQIKGELKAPTNLLGITKELAFDSKSQEKVLKRYLTRLSRKLSLRQINLFLHFLYKKVYKLDSVPYLDLSEKELKIQKARKEWKAAALKAEELRNIYKVEKGDYYKKERV